MVGMTEVTKETCDFSGHNPPIDYVTDTAYVCPVCLHEEAWISGLQRTTVKLASGYVTVRASEYFQYYHNHTLKVPSLSFNFTP